MQQGKKISGPKTAIIPFIRAESGLISGFRPEKRHLRRFTCRIQTGNRFPFGQCMSERRSLWLELLERRGAAGIS